MSVSIPLKKKYRPGNAVVLHRQGIDPPDGTLVWHAESHTYRGRTGNSNGPTPKRKPCRVKSRRRAYGPFYSVKAQS